MEAVTRKGGGKVKLESSFEKPLGIKELNTFVANHFKVDPQFSGVFVRGEISNFTTNSKSNHSYFTLKDEGAQIGALMFSFNSAKMFFRPENGMKVIAHGSVGIYIPGGQYQLNVDKMEPDGVGALHIAYEQLRAKLEKEGLFDPARKKPLPKRPRVVGVITSPTGAAVRDIINVSTRRFPYAKILVYPASVQGERAVGELISGMRYFNESRSADVIIIGRGGGSIEDLWAFNDETLARTLAASKIPVISAVGHERDFTICDEAADVRAPTPSAAAEYAVPETRELVEKIRNLIPREEKIISARIGRYREILSRFAESKALSSPMYFVNDRRVKTNDLYRRLCSRMESLSKERELTLGALSGKLDSLSPLAVLSRGYSAVFTPKGDVVKNAADISIGDDVVMRMNDGEAKARVSEVILDKDRGDSDG